MMVLYKCLEMVLKTMCGGVWFAQFFLFFFLIWIPLNPFGVSFRSPLFSNMCYQSKKFSRGYFWSCQKRHSKIKVSLFPSNRGVQVKYNISTSSSFSFLYKKKTASLNQENPVDGHHKHLFPSMLSHHLFEL